MFQNLLKNKYAKTCQIKMQASSINVDSNLWKSRPRNNIIDVNIEINRENVWKIVLSQTTMLKFVKLLCNYLKNVDS